MAFRWLASQVFVPAAFLFAEEAEEEKERYANVSKVSKYTLLLKLAAITRSEKFISDTDDERHAELEVK